MPHLQHGLWREKEANVKPKQCAKCQSKRLRFLQSYANDDDEFDDECNDAWAEARGENLNTAEWDQRFYFYQDYYECIKCGHYAAWGARHYFNPSSSNYDLDRPLMPDAAKRAQLEHERQQARDAGQLSLFETGD